MDKNLESSASMFFYKKVIHDHAKDYDVLNFNFFSKRPKGLYLFVDQKKKGF